MNDQTMICGRASEESVQSPVSAQSADLNQENSMTEPTMNETVPQSAPKAENSALATDEKEQKGTFSKMLDSVVGFFKNAGGRIAEGGRVAWKVTTKFANDVVKTFTTKNGYSELCGKIGDNAGKILAIGASALAFQYIIMQFGLIVAIAALALAYVVFKAAQLLLNDEPLHMLAGVEAPVPTTVVPQAA